MIMVALEALENILKVDDITEGGGSFAAYVHQEGGLDRIEQLQGHSDDEVYQKAVSIIDAYFGFEDNHLGDTTTLQGLVMEAPDVPEGGVRYCGSEEAGWGSESSSVGIEDDSYMEETLSIDENECVDEAQCTDEDL